ncbi:hypothetical protein [Streptomyces sp. LN704]|uniref:hypothetical protein n=1 Tax=Streptomyces sp. LN704 TaxID=3112982 RepID=UPI003720DB26
MSPSIAFAANGARYTLGVDDADVGDRAEPRPLRGAPPGAARTPARFAGTSAAAWPVTASA